MQEATQNFRLEFASPDILREFFNYLTAKEISLLYACGSTLLNVKMCTPRTIEKWEMRLSNDGTFKWPSLISCLKSLRHIEVIGAFPTHFTDIFGLPKSLEYIKFEFWEAEIAFAPTPPLPLIHSSLVPNCIEADASNMKFLFPNLKHLILDGSECISDFFISTLPPALETLELATDRKGPSVMVTASCLDYLPSNLTRLKMTAPFLCNSETFLKLPRSLTSLELIGAVIDSRSVLSLPPSLRVLQIPKVHGLRDFDIKCLPTTLEVLDVLECDGITMVCFEDLPRGLKELTMWRLEDNIANANHIPRKVSLLPPNLVRFKVVSSKGWSNAATQALPQSLQHLVLHNVRERLNDDFAIFLPRTLLTLVLFCDRTYVSSKCFKDLPQTLTKLELSSTGSYKDEDFENLPKTLLDLDLGHAVQATNACIPLLPRGLTRLYLRRVHRVTGESAIDLPRNLTFLSLSMCQSYASKYFQHLPRSLAHLSLRSATDVQPVAFRALPRELKYLDLNSARSFSPAYLLDLPPRIKHLSLSSAALIRQYHELHQCKPARSKALLLSHSAPPPPSHATNSLWNASTNLFWRLLSPSGH